MRIKECNTYIVSQRLNDRSFCYSQAWYNTRTILLLEIVTDDGLTGVGEAFGNAFINQAVIEHVYKPRLLNQHVFDSEKIWDDLYNCLRDNGQKGSCIEALSAVDNALWDLKGKYTHMPVYRLLGGARRDKIIPYATGLYHSNSETLEKDLIEEACTYIRDGFRGVKMKIGFGLEDDVRMVRLVREAIGDDFTLMVDPNHAYNARTAVELARQIEPYHIAWIEEPVPPEDIAGYVEVKAKSNIPISGGEAEFTQYGFSRLIRARGVDILQPDCSITGGLTAFRKIASMAQIENIQCYPHVWGSGVAVSVGLNAAFAMPDFPDALCAAPVYFELDRTPNIFREELNKNKIEIQDGYIYLPEFEGLGVELNRELIEKYRIG